MARTVTVLPPTINRETSAPIGSKAKRKVAAYARVSTDHEEQRAKFKESIKGSYTPERRKAMSEHMKQVRRERHWNSKGKSKQSQQP